MNFKTMKKKVEILEKAFAASAGAYYSINLTQNIVPGQMYQVIDGKEYSINAQTGLPENAPFTEVVSYWGRQLDAKEQPAFFEFLAIPHLIQCFRKGETHVCHRYWTKSALFEPMLAEQHIAMFADEENGDVLAITYVLDLTQDDWEEKYKKRLEDKQRSLEKSLATLHEERMIQEALSTDYTSEYICDFDTDQLIPLKQTGGSNAQFVNEDLQDQRFIFSVRMAHYYHKFVLRESAPDFLEKVNASYLRQYLAEHERFSYRYQARPNPDGWQHFEIQMVRLPNTDGAKTVLGFRYVDHVIAEEERQRERLQNANARLEDQIHIISGLANAYFAVYWVDLHHNTCRAIKNIDFFHQAVQDCSTTDDVVEMFLSLCVMPDDQEKMRSFTDWRALPEQLREHDTIVEEFHGALSPWEWCRASWIVASRDRQGIASEVLFAVEDTTQSVLERKQYEQELKKARDAATAANRAKTTFLFNMSHDIRTPMNAIVGYTELLRKHSGDQKRCDDYVAKIQSSSDFLLSLINNVLEMARIESGKAVLDEAPIRCGKITETVKTVYAEEMKKKHIAFSSTLHVQNDSIYCDQLKMKEVLLNLLSNAYKYTPEGGRVTMDTRELPCDRPGYVCLQTKISDNGIGMSEDYLPTLFEEFTRERNSAGNRIEGTGLGMAIVKSLVELMGGTIEVESELGKGTTFTVTICHRIAREEDIHSDARNTVNTGYFIGKRVLLAEDNDLNAEIAMEILKEYGFLVERAADGVICVDLLQKAEAGYFDLILMDVQMPNLNGYQATRRIRALPDPVKRKIPILAMTANAFEEDRRNALAAGMDEHIAKPIDAVTVMKKLAAVLTQREHSDTCCGRGEGASGKRKKKKK